MRWSNVPLPEAHIAAIVTAAGMQFLLPLRLPLGDEARWPVAASFAAAGVGLGAWAVASASDADVEHVGRHG